MPGWWMEARRRRGAELHPEYSTASQQLAWERASERASELAICRARFIASYIPRRGDFCTSLRQSPSGRSLPLERPYAARTIEKPARVYPRASKRFDIRLERLRLDLQRDQREIRRWPAVQRPPSLTVTYRNAGEERDIRRRSTCLPVRGDRKGRERDEKKEKERKKDTRGK